MLVVELLKKQKNSYIHMNNTHSTVCEDIQLTELMYFQKKST